jgi:hypothetical protein
MTVEIVLPARIQPGTSERGTTAMQMAYSIALVGSND